MNANKFDGIPSIDETGAGFRYAACTCRGCIPKGRTAFATAAQLAHTPAPMPVVEFRLPGTCRSSSARNCPAADQDDSAGYVLRGVVGLSWGERERDGHRASAATIRPLVVHPARERPLAWGPSGWTLTMVLSIDTASSLIRTMRSRCRCSNTLSSTPFLDQRFIRV